MIGKFDVWRFSLYNRIFEEHSKLFRKINEKQQQNF